MTTAFESFFFFKIFYIFIFLYFLSFAACKISESSKRLAEP